MPDLVTLGLINTWVISLNGSRLGTDKQVQLVYVEIKRLAVEQIA
jgi:hypothetical protein